MRLTLYRFRLLLQDYPIIDYIIKKVNLIQQGQSAKSTIIEIELKNFLTKNEN